MLAVHRPDFYKSSNKICKLRASNHQLFPDRGISCGCSRAGADHFNFRSARELRRTRLLNLRVRYSLFPERKFCPLFEQPALLLAGCGLFKGVISGLPSFPRYSGTGPYGVVLGESHVEPSGPLDAAISSFPPHGWVRRAPRLRVRERLRSRRRRHVVACGEVWRALLRGLSAVRTRHEGPVGKCWEKCF